MLKRMPRREIPSTTTCACYVMGKSSSKMRRGSLSSPPPTQAVLAHGLCKRAKCATEASMPLSPKCVHGGLHAQLNEQSLPGMPVLTSSWVGLNDQQTSLHNRPLQPVRAQDETQRERRPRQWSAPRIDQQNPTHPQREISEPVIAAPGIQCAIIPAEMIAAPPAKSEAPAFQLRPLAAWHRSATIHAYGSYQAVPEEDAVSNGDASQPRSIP